MMILCIETSAANCSVSVLDAENIIDYLESQTLNDHAQSIGKMLEYMMHTYDIQAIAISSGPGSYTGLRIGTSIAKGLCVGKQIPLISVSTLKILESSFIETRADNDNNLYIISARKNEFFAYSSSSQTALNIAPKLYFDSEINWSAYKNIIIPDWDFKNNELFLNYNTIRVTFNAKNMKLAYHKFINSDFEDIAYFEPDYLKPVYIT